MPKRTDAPERRQQLCDALADELCEQAYEAISVGRIAQRAGLASGLVHYYFPTKRAMLLTVAAQVTARWGERLATLSAVEQTPAEHLAAWVNATLALGEGANERDAALWTGLTAEAARSDDVRAVLAPIAEAQLTLLQQHFSACGVARPEVAALALLATVNGLWQGSALGTVPTGTAADTAQLVLRSLLKVD